MRCGARAFYSPAMAYLVQEFQATPNPNALKCVLDKAVARPDAGGTGGGADAARSYFTREQASADPVAAALFAIEGVTNVLIVKDWVTVSKAPGAEWGKLKPKIKTALAGVGGAGGAGGAGTAGKKA